MWISLRLEPRNLPRLHEKIHRPKVGSELRRQPVESRGSQLDLLSRFNQVVAPNRRLVPLLSSLRPAVELGMKTVLGQAKRDQRLL